LCPVYLHASLLNCRSFSDGFLVYFINVFFKLIHFHVCVFEKEINIKKNIFYFVRSFLYGY
jgi:hypothetical protein